MIRINLLQKKCSRCTRTKGATKFSVHARGLYKRMAWCKACQAEYQRDHRPGWYEENRAKANASARASVKRYRDAVLDLYGGKCACCKEGKKNFLTLEHVLGGGSAHRRAKGSPYAFWKSVFEEGLCPDKYSVLCYNCNCSRGFYGYCCDPSAVPLLYHSQSYLN